MYGSKRLIISVDFGKRHIEQINIYKGFISRGFFFFPFYYSTIHGREKKRCVESIRVREKGS